MAIFNSFLYVYQRVTMYNPLWVINRYQPTEVPAKIFVLDPRHMQHHDHWQDQAALDLRNMEVESLGFFEVSLVRMDTTLWLWLT